MNNWFFWISALEAVAIILLVRKCSRLQKEVDDECSGELAEMQEYANYLEAKLRNKEN